MEAFKRRIQGLINIYHLLRAVGMTLWYGNAGKRLRIIGVTGTDGKTTTTSLIYHILKASGKNSSVLTSVYAKIGEREYDTGLHMTTPDSSLVQQLLKKSADHGDEFFVLETTSHAFDQNRNWGINYEVGVITNITSEHLDYHKSYDSYLHTKAKLLKRSKVTLLNRDDMSYEKLVSLARKYRARTLSYGFRGDADFHTDFRKTLRLDIPEFNGYNYLAAYGVCRTLGLGEAEILSALKTFSLPKGRLETVYSGQFSVMVDFAHTTNSIMQILKYIRGKTKGRIIHVFGAAGLRDAIKRPHMGEASSQNADVIILTEEDYRTEDPVMIADQIAGGINPRFKRVTEAELGEKSNSCYSVIFPRDRAIGKAIRIARSGDIVLCTGKSHEKSLCRGTKEMPWDEYESIKSALSERRLTK